MTTTNELEEQRIEAFLAPLRAVSPVTRRQASVRPRGHARRLVLLAAAVLTIGTGVAAARAILVSSQQATRSPLSSGETFACQGLEGMRADRAADFFARRGLQVSWRFTEYFAPGTHGGLSGYAIEPRSVPSNSVVEDVDWLDASTVIVSVRAPDDPNAPPIPSPNCPR